MATVLVTGGSGKLGQFVVRHLRSSGWSVVSVDRVRHPDSTVQSTVVDLMDAGAVMDMVSSINERHEGLDAIVHLAAIPAPGIAPDKTTIDNNFNSTLNVFMAARNAGVKKVVFASSETVLGLPFDTPPPYVPVDEEYEPRPESFYSLSKVLEERLAREFAAGTRVFRWLACAFPMSLTLLSTQTSKTIKTIPWLVSGTYGATSMLETEPWRLSEHYCSSSLDLNLLSSPVQIQLCARQIPNC